MPLPEHTRQRYEVQRKFHAGNRLTRKSTGEVFVMGLQLSVYDCWLMRLSPMGKYRMTWRAVLDDFEVCDGSV